MTVSEIQGHLTELYGIDVSPDLISRFRMLSPTRSANGRTGRSILVYPTVFFDALRVNIQDEGLAKDKAVYVALAFNADGEKEVLGLWIKQTEGAKFWLKIISVLKARGVNDILIAVVDGLKGFSGGDHRSASADAGFNQANGPGRRECSNEDDDLQRKICIVPVFYP